MRAFMYRITFASEKSPCLPPRTHSTVQMLKKLGVPSKTTDRQGQQRANMPGSEVRQRQQAAAGEQDSTKQLLQEVVEQLALQTEELKHIRRSSATTNTLLSAIHHLIEQILLLIHNISHLCSCLAAALAEHLASVAAAQAAARLQGTLSSGRLLMCLTLTVLALVNIRTAFTKQCMAAPASSWSTAARTVLERWSGRPGKQQHQRGVLGLWVLATTSAQSGRCVVTFAGRYGTGCALLCIWLTYAWRMQQHCSSTGAAYGHVSTTKPDSVITLLLAAVPSGPSSSSSSKLSAWTAVLQAALYEGAVGGISLLLLSGRWSLWLLLWEAWLAWVFYCCCYSTSHTPWSSSSSRASTVQAVTDSRNALQGSGVEGSVAIQQEPFWLQQLPSLVASSAAAAAAVAGPAAEPAAASRGHQLQVVLQHVLLALLHLLLPVLLAAAGLRR